MIEEQEIKYYHWLMAVKQLPNSRKEKLLHYAGTAQAVYQMSEKDLRQSGIFEYFSPKHGKAAMQVEERIQGFLRERSNWDVEDYYGKLEKEGILFIPRYLKGYPDKLRNIPDAPLGIYCKGKLPKLNQFSVAVIGARDCDSYGSMMAREYGNTLAHAGIPLISGMARGIDGMSQLACVEQGGYSVGVLGSGVDICYPKENRRLYDLLAQKGTLLSEYVPGVMPQPQFFPARNRLISGLADILLVIQAREKSGTWITVDMALEQGREVYALPGRVTDKLSAGCNKLIKQGANLLGDPVEFIEEMKQCYESIMQRSVTSPKEESTYEEKPYSELECEVLKLLEVNPKSLELIYQQIQGVKECSLAELIEALMELAVLGVVQQVQGGFCLKKVTIHRTEPTSK